MHKEGLVSVVIPVYNGEKYLGEAIESVLGQTYKDIEAVVVDDSSIDNTAEVVKSYGTRIKYLKIPHGGPGAARNAGLNIASGEFLSFLDADDIWLKDKTEIQVNALRLKPSLDAVFGRVMQFRSDLPDATMARHDEPRPGYLPGAMLIRRNSFLRNGYFPADRKVGEFIEWYALAKESGIKSIMLADIVLKRRIHRTNLGIRQRGDLSDYAKVIKTMLDRRRGKL